MLGLTASSWFGNTNRAARVLLAASDGGMWTGPAPGRVTANRPLGAVPQVKNRSDGAGFVAAWTEAV